MFRVVTDLAVFDFDEETRRMRAIALNPGVSCEQVQANTGFPLAFACDLQETEPPSAEELAMLRYLDPERKYTAS
jgi:glutaconate CoA-transferase subunit B